MVVCFRWPLPITHAEIHARLALALSPHAPLFLSLEGLFACDVVIPAALTPPLLFLWRRNGRRDRLRAPLRLTLSVGLGRVAGLGWGSEPRRSRASLPGTRMFLETTRFSVVTWLASQPVHVTTSPGQGPHSKQQVGQPGMASKLPVCEHDRPAEQGAIRAKISGLSKGRLQGCVNFPPRSRVLIPCSQPRPHVSSWRSEPSTRLLTTTLPHGLHRHHPPCQV